jgi:hypothetical protein
VSPLAILKRKLMLTRLAQSVRAAVNDPSCVSGFVEAWVGNRTPARRPRTEHRFDLGAVAELRRLLLWASSPVIRSRGYPGDAAIDDQIVDLFTAAGPSAREQMHRELTRILSEPSAPAFTHAMRLAGRVPVPPARTLLLGYLSGDDAMGDHPCRESALRALGRLRQPELRTIFSTLIERYAQRGLWDEAARAILHQAGWSLCRLDPHAFVDELPWLLQSDPLFLADALADPPVRPVVRRWLETVPADRVRILRPWIDDAINA